MEGFGVNDEQKRGKGVSLNGASSNVDGRPTVALVEGRGSGVCVDSSHSLDHVCCVAKILHYGG